MFRSTELLPSINDWEQFLQQNERAPHDSVIDAASETIDAVIQSRLLPLYAMRAIAYAKKGQFDLAHRDADEIIRLQPGSAKGYLCKGEVYAIQMKPASVTRILTDGLSKVSNLDPDFHEFQSRTKAANDQLERRVDFIAKVPVEVMGEILRHICIDQLLELVHISKTWRTRILEFPNAWASFNAEILDPQQVNQLCHLMPIISNFLVSADIDISSEHLLRAFTTQVQNGRIRRLDTLGLLYPDGKYDNECHVDLNTLLDTIPRTDNQLTDICLRATFSYSSVLPFLYEALKRCPKLKSLSIVYPCMFMSEPNAMESPISHGLASLTLKCSELDLDIVEPLLRHCNRLRSLCIYAQEEDFLVDEGILEIAQKHGKQLEALDLNSGEDPYELPAESKSPGLRFLQLGPELTFLPSLAPLLYKHHTTLEELFLPISEDANPIAAGKRALTMLRGRSFPLLSRLNISVLPETEDAVIEIIRGCNKLEDLTIDAPIPRIAYQVLVRIAAHPTHHLQHLVDLAIQTSAFGDVGDGLKVLFEAFASLGTKSLLRKVFFQGFKIPPSSDVLMLWAGLHKIHSISLFDLRVSRWQMEELRRKCTESKISLTAKDGDFSDYSGFGLY